MFRHVLHGSMNFLSSGCEVPVPFAFSFPEIIKVSEVSNNSMYNIMIFNEIFHSVQHI